MLPAETPNSPTDYLQQALQSLTGMTEEEFNLSRAYWKPKTFSKGDYYNQYRHVCKQLGFIFDGVFRAYYVDEKNQEKNVFFFSKNQVVVSFQSFIHQTPCNYFTQAMTDAQIAYISYDQLHELYKKSHAWEKLGRVLAELAFSVSMGRTESFLFKSPEERYLDLIQQHPDIFNSIPLYHISSYLGFQGPSLSRIRKRLAG
jgi:CRP-like cAMP-binding protein